MSQQDALNSMAARYHGYDEEPHTRPLIITGNISSDPKIMHWRCLVCLGHGYLLEDALPLTAEVHKTECVGDHNLAAARADLLQAISNESEYSFAAGWLTGIEKIILKRGGMWAVLAENIGWPYGYNGLVEWDQDLDTALARYNWTRDNLDCQLPD